MARAKAPKCIKLDFETEGIASRPDYPPKPVGVAIQLVGKPSRYWAWGHPAGNNCTKEQATEQVKAVYREVNSISGPGMLCQNAKFDVDVAQAHLGLPVPRWDKLHDTMYQIFMYDPHSPNLSLKPSAERILGMTPEERDHVKDWVLANVKGAKKSDWGRYISLAPGTLVAPYANGDNERTDKLHNFLWPDLHARNMVPAYDRERHLMPILLRNEIEGIRVNLPLLVQDFGVYTKALIYADNWLRKTLKSPHLNVDSDAEVAEAFDICGIIENFPLTPTGKRSVSKKNLLPEMFLNQKVFQVFSYRNKVQTTLAMFIEPWIEMASKTGGTIHASWNQIRGEGGGARTGRPSCKNPNLLNVPKPFGSKDPDYKHPVFLKLLPELPVIRRYVLPDFEEHLVGRRDYNQQELRLTAHFEGASLCNSYQHNPRFDLHTLVQKGVREIAAVELSRDDTKIVNFQDIYGGGLNALMEKLRIPRALAQKIKDAKRELMPDFASMVDEIKEVGKSGQPIITWGGREYYVEEPKWSATEKRMLHFEYKLLNYLIQGSAAEITKEAVINYAEHPKRQGRFMLYVYDEIDFSAHRKHIVKEMKLLRDVMQAVKCDVPMLSDGEIGPDWGTLTKFVEPEFDILAWRRQNGLKNEDGERGVA